MKVFTAADTSATAQAALAATLARNWPNPPNFGKWRTNMTTNVKRKPSIKQCYRRKYQTDSVCGILIILLMIAMLVTPLVFSDWSIPREAVPITTTEGTAPHTGPSPVELIPILSGGIGGSTSLGGGPSLGGGSH